MKVIVCALCVWYGLGLIGSGFAVAESLVMDQRFGLWSESELAEHRREHIGFGVTWAIGGPISLIVGYTSTGFGQYGWWTHLK
jgi:hypothetical protein